MAKRLKMPTYVIIQKRDFENLFSTVEREGDQIIGLNGKKSNKTKKGAGLRVLDTSITKTKNPKKRKRFDSGAKNSIKIDEETQDVPECITSGGDRSPSKQSDSESGSESQKEIKSSEQCYSSLSSDSE